MIGLKATEVQISFSFFFASDSFIHFLPFTSPSLPAISSCSSLSNLLRLLPPLLNLLLSSVFFILIFSFSHSMLASLSLGLLSRSFPRLAMSAARPFSVSQSTCQILHALKTFY